ncbi:MAG: site-2 protease family protein [Patescibacteria group bacterium]|nr:site-2 protease family protein [Patescibacteria group bacterium]
MLIQLLFSNPTLFFMATLSILFALTLHEYSHAQMAYFLGDPTPGELGRLTVNPLAHLDPFGTIFLFLFGIGWGRPVPFNPLNLRNQRWGPALIALAGPLTNFLMALVVGLILRFLSLTNSNLIIFFSIFVWLNILLGVFNLMPIPPLDGSHIIFSIFPSSLARTKELLKQSFLLVIFAIFFMVYIGIPYLCRPLFGLITGIPFPIF